MPASSTPGIRTARQPRYCSRSASSSEPAEERGLGRGQGPQPRLLGPGADDPQRPARAAVGVEDEIEALVGGEGGDDEVVGAGAVVARGEEGRVDRRRDHDRVAPVVAADAAGHPGAVRGEAVDAGGGPHVPGAQARRDRPDREGGRGATRGRGRSSRRSGPRRSASACGSSTGAARPGAGRTPLAAQWELESTRSKPREVERLRRRGEERQVVAVARRHRRAGAARRRCGSSRASSSGATEPFTWRRVKMGASGKSRARERRTFSPPRIPVSQSWTRATFSSWPPRWRARDARGPSCTRRGWSARSAPS